MAFDAFVSYSSKDKTAADATCAVLEGAGVRCWIAPRDIRPGGEYGAAIIDAIDQCRVMVLIFSSSANDSRQIHREIERAVTKGIPIVPVRIEEVAPTKSMEYFLGAIHWLDALTPPIEKHLQHLAETVRAILQVDIAARGEPANDSLTKTSAPGPGREANPATPAYATARSPAGAGGFSSKNLARMNWFLPALGGGICVALLAAGVWLYQTRVHVPEAVPSAAAPQPAPKQAEALVPETVPFIADSDRALIRSTYLSASDHKALAISQRSVGYITGQKDEESAKTAALEACKRVSGTAAGNCQLYAVGNAVVFKGGRPPLPPEPWVIGDPATERPFASKAVPLLRDSDRTWLEKNFVPARKPKAAAIAPRRTVIFTGQSNIDEAVRRSLEWCGFLAGTPCMIVAVDDAFVVPIPTTMEATGFFRASDALTIAPDAREGIARRLANATTGWNAVAVGASGRAGLMLKAAKEQDAVDGAMADCSKQDRACRVIAIGPFTVQPIDPSKPVNVTAEQSQQPKAPADALVPETVPFIADSERALIRSTYLSGPDHKALAVSNRIGFITGQKDEETAKTAALEACKRVSGPVASSCQLYAVGNAVVFKGGRPPVPPEPWVARDPAIERPFVAKDVPLLRDSEKTWLEKNFVPARKPKAAAIAPGRTVAYFEQSSVDEAVRRSLERCGFLAGAACMIVAVDDVFVVPIPTTMKVTGFFHATNTTIAPEARDDIARRLGNSAGGWSAVAVGAAGRPGLMLKAANEQDAIDGAMADCGKQDRGCRVIAIGPFSVEPSDPVRN